jgi:hypothetical protein
MTSPFREAMEARDLDAVVDAFAPDAVVYSPITARLTFSGLLDDHRGVLVARARVAGEEIEIVEYMRFDQDRRIRELTAFFRPMPAIAAATRALGTGLGRRRSRRRAALISLATRALGLMVRAGDRIGTLLVRPTI